MQRPTTRSRPLLIALALSVGCLALVACGDDDDETTTTTTAAPDEVSEDEPVDDEATDEDATGEPVLVTAVDYAYEGVPADVEAGTELALTNASETEVHEIVLLKVADDETRSLDELLALPEAERDQITEFRGVTVAFPGQDAAFTDGSMTLEDPGRYVLVCTIPQGADPQAYRDAVADPDAAGPPEVEGGPPHLVLGMVTEVEAG